MRDVKFYLRDRDADVVRAWTKHFADTPQVEASQGDIFDVPADAIVSPANSFGFMDGGIDLAYSYRFGWQLQERLQELLRTEHDGELPVGDAVIIETGDADYRYLVSAPTMRMPMIVSNTVNAYLAFRATLRAVREHNRRGEDKIRSVLCPGLATATGAMSPEVCARQMWAAYAICVLGQMNSPQALWEVSDEHQRLIRADD
ncbi:MAG: macro domain-containing protein [Pyrinomonadaceae bacterium]|nr:macro domain-containing protein [Pyrinomonadaceae bacterium]